MGLEAPLESLDRLHLDWFDQWLKGRETDAARMPAIRWFLMGGGSGHRTRLGNLDHGGCWREGDGWPLPQAEPTAYYLQPDRTLSPRPSDRKESSTSYLYDPRRPVPTIGGNFSSLSYVHPWPEGVRPESVPTPTMIEAVTPAGGFDQTEGPDFFGCTPPYLPLGSRPDVLVFETPPLERDMEIAGPVEVRLWVSSSARDTDFTAKLIDVYPSSPDYPLGYALNLSDSILRVRYRESRSRARFLEPDEVVSITIVLYPTANRCRKGHRIRLDVSSSNFPRFDVNPNTGEPWAGNGAGPSPTTPCSTTGAGRHTSSCPWSPGDGFPATGLYQPVAKVVTAFDRPCIPADCVAIRAHTPGMHPNRALSGGRRNGLGARATFTTD